MYNTMYFISTFQVVCIGQYKQMFMGGCLIKQLEQQQQYILSCRIQQILQISTFVAILWQQGTVCDYVASLVVELCVNVNKNDADLLQSLVVRICLNFVQIYSQHVLD
eukprot:TRINITY_DN3821_c0_g2_i3.p4 TRINITY_DN3821_c0_g2~~TRINITY_DN3821_c0_g2_i3.p4  ORF type:complete len:108 (-),score=10.57 TRINITY_DN3821_c0_g2_i3:22-345(-)